MISAMPATASATTYQTYVGLKIESVNNPNETNPTEWCLPGGTKMTITTDGATPINKCGVGLNEPCVVTTTSSTGSYGVGESYGCDQDTIWSDLVELTSGTYSIGLATLTLDGVNFHAEGDYIWFGYGPAGDSCDTYCQSLGGQCVDPGVHDVDLSCADMELMTGETYTCTSSTGAGSPFWTGAHNKWFEQGTADTYTCSAVMHSAYNRFCTCDGLYATYTFTFQAP